MKKVAFVFGSLNANEAVNKNNPMKHTGRASYNEKGKISCQYGNDNYNLIVHALKHKENGYVKRVGNVCFLCGAYEYETDNFGHAESAEMQAEFAFDKIKKDVVAKLIREKQKKLKELIKEQNKMIEWIALSKTQI